jgi:hypothetical protein
MFSVAVLFTACGENSDEAKEYDIQLALNSGEYDKAISLLGDCSSYSGTKKENCYLDKGSAYFGKADFDRISMAQDFAGVADDLNSTEESKAINKIIFKKLDDKNLQLGITEYKQVLKDSNSSVCTEANFKSLSINSRQACLAINPILLIDVLDEDNNDTNKSTLIVSLEQIIEFKDVLKDAVPELNSEDLISVFDGDTLDTQKDANQNGTLDSIEATNYAINVFALNKSWTDTNVSSDYNRTDTTYTHTALKDKNITLTKITISGAENNNSFYRLIEYTKDFNTTLTTIPNTVCLKDNKPIEGATTLRDYIDKNSSYLPCILIEDRNATTFNDSVVGALNSDLIQSIALTKDSDDKKTDTQKVAEFKTEICDSNGTVSTTNLGKCKLDTNNKVIITQEALISYMSKSK